MAMWPRVSFEPGVTGANFVWRNDDGLLVGRDVPIAPQLARRASPTFCCNRPHHFNPRLNRNAIQGEIAPNPAGAAGGGREWLAFDDGGGREGEAGDE